LTRRKITLSVQIVKAKSCDAIVAINSIPQQEVANGNGQSELARHTYNIIQFGSKKTFTSNTIRRQTIFIFESSFLYFEL
jgi:hypothetical protein